MTGTHAADYIVVGGGTSGLVVAHRLANETNASVLVLEAGRDSESSPDVLVPGKWSLGDANDSTETTQWPDGHMVRGKQLGGSSAVNYMAMARGPSDDYNEWARRTGDKGWRWENVLPRMKAMEDFNPEIPTGFEHLASPNAANHGQRGPIKLGFGHEMTPGVSKFVTACQQTGIPLCPDINSGNPVGVGLAQCNVRDGIRSYATNAYLDEAFRVQNRNLRIQTGIMVHRLLVEDCKVVGVVGSEQGKTTETWIMCSREVILCAGTFLTPQILLMSGIGPKTTVNELNLPLIRDTPGVGQGMLDHSILTLEFRVNDSSIDFSRLFENAELLREAEEQYKSNKTGLLSIFGTSGAVAFPKTEKLENSTEFWSLDEANQAFLMHPKRPSAEIWLGSGRSAFTGAAKLGQSFITFELLLQNNLSHGTVTVVKAKSGAALEIDPKYLDHPYDRRIAIESVRTALQISRAQAYEDDIIEMVHGPESDDDVSIMEFIRRNLGQGYHSVGTCRMGASNDSAAVVDGSFNVIGVPGVKIADLSVCPVLTCNHTQINAYLIGDRCANVLVQEWQSAHEKSNGLS